MTTDPSIEYAETFAGVPDAFSRLWTPYRMAYIKGENKPANTDSTDCPFCLIPQRDDPDGLVVHRGETAYVVMNLYPYAPGHLLVCPYRHVSDYINLTKQETIEFGELTQTAIKALKLVSSPQGFNIGMNQGQVAGAGIAAHLHQHVVPRFLGDSNFMPIIGQTRALPQLLSDARQLLTDVWEAAGGDAQ